MANRHGGAYGGNADKSIQTTESDTHYEHTTFNRIPGRGRAQPCNVMSAANFSLTPSGRVLLHLACLYRHPAATRFFLTGLSRNLCEWCRHCTPWR